MAVLMAQPGLGAVEQGAAPTTDMSTDMSDSYTKRESRAGFSSLSRLLSDVCAERISQLQLPSLHQGGREHVAA